MRGYSPFTPFGAVKNLNKSAVLDLIRFSPGGVSRVELARQIGVTRAAVTAIVNDLLASGLVCETSSRQAVSGRRPIVLEINPAGGWVAGIDMGATHVSIILVDFSAYILQEIEAPFDITKGPEICLYEVDLLLRDLLNKAGLKIEDIQATGVGVPGPVSLEEGTVSTPPIMPGWHGYPIRDHLEELWGCPVWLSNDADLGALGEWAYGAGRGERNLVYIKVGTGIGAGLLLDGQIYQGETGAAGEIGHVTIDEHGPLCTCGNHGCLEAMSGGRAISRRAKEAVSEGVRTQLATIQPLDSLTARDVLSAAHNGDLYSQQLVTEAGEHLGTAIASLVNLVNPGVIVIGGGISEIGDLLLEPIRRTVHKRSLRGASRVVRISTSLLGRRSTAMGAAVQALTIVLHRQVERKEVRKLQSIRQSPEP
jgi:glucokinase-like ROK family protein